jgi:RNA polymerase sigma-70 factor (ECF subfamily)
MSPETRAFLDGVRHADEPTHEDQRRVLRAVHAAVAASALVAGAGALGAAKTTKISAFFGMPGLKLGAVLVGLGAVVWVSGWVVPTRDAVPLRAPPDRTASAPVPIASVARTSPTVVAEPEKPAARPRASTETRLQGTPKASLREEIELLAEVQAALARGDGATALARLDGHVTTDRQFRAERRAARILALCALGRADEARQGATVFLRDDPASVQRSAIERSCAGGERGEER